MAAEQNKRYAVVTGANKGIGFGVCKQLASNGIVVILTARDEKRGLEAVQKLKDAGLSDYVVFHQLDVADSASIDVLADFIKSKFGKLDILVNNAGVTGVKVRTEAPKDVDPSKVSAELGGVMWYDMLNERYEVPEECFSINYYGAKTMIEKLIPLLQLSDSPRIVNVSSGAGKMEYLLNEWAIKVLQDDDSLSDEKIDEVLTKYLEDFKEGSLESKGWPADLSSYKLSKASINAYTRIIAKKFPTFRINCLCPGYVKTDINLNTGVLSVEEGAESVVRLALLSDDGPSGSFFDQKNESSF
ncbi:(+)-neomenthol dehydrogenase-like [Euphorbia lathyris]|uniref:(+)-neomenthol dehydrogenase-like n=1 Tax=Euphorbia lathyris TaxID=212925 RepID=UPI00331420B0